MHNNQNEHTRIMYWPTCILHGKSHLCDENSRYLTQVTFRTRQPTPTAFAFHIVGASILERHTDWKGSCTLYDNLSKECPEICSGNAIADPLIDGLDYLHSH